MNKIFPVLPSGMKDYGPKEVLERNYIVDIIRKYFVAYGFEPIETSAIEKTDILTKKYGEEANKLIFNILNSGDFLQKVPPESFGNFQELQKYISQKALRYDLTVPLARYISANRDKHTLPFKRYQIQSVWRADRPQKGRLREFLQCDVDIIGTKSIVAEVELIQMSINILQDLGIKGYKIKINHRKIVNSLIYAMDEYNNAIFITTVLDKIDKTGLDKAVKALGNKGIKNIPLLLEILNYKGNNIEKIEFISSKLVDIKENLEGTDSIKKILKYIEYTDINYDSIGVDFSMVRGLSYYTGTILEIIIDNHNIGSIGGGGRYDNMASDFGFNVSGVGIAFGLDRIWNVMQEQNILPKQLANTTKMLVCNFDCEVIEMIINLTSRLRALGLCVEMCYTTATLKKQLEYANKKNIPFVVLMGEKEADIKSFILKNMKNGSQEILKLNCLENIVQYVKEGNI